MSSELAMPLVLMAMGGEMLYILQQRLSAQMIAADKAQTVLEDVICSMFDPSLMNELFRREKVYTAAGTRALFDRLAHVSIMRLNTSSMDKLYVLISMGCKLQIMRSAHPSQLLQLCLNHLDEARAMTAGTRVPAAVASAASHSATAPYPPSAATATAGAAAALLNHATRRFCALALSSPPESLALARRSVLRMLQDRNAKVSIFLQDALQSSTGAVYCTPAGEAPVGAEPPGTHRVFARARVSPSAAAAAAAAAADTDADADAAPASNAEPLLSGTGAARVCRSTPPVFPSVSASSFTVSSHAHHTRFYPDLATLHATAASQQQQAQEKQQPSLGAFIGTDVPPARVCHSYYPHTSSASPASAGAGAAAAAATAVMTVASRFASSGYAPAAGVQPSPFAPRRLPSAPDAGSFAFGVSSSDTSLLDQGLTPSQPGTASAAAAAAAATVVSVLHPRRACTIGRNLYLSERKQAAANAAPATDSGAPAVPSRPPPSADAAAANPLRLLPAVAPTARAVAAARAAAHACFDGVWHTPAAAGAVSEGAAAASSATAFGEAAAPALSAAVVTVSTAALDAEAAALTQLLRKRRGDAAAAAAAEDGFMLTHLFGADDEDEEDENIAAEKKAAAATDAEGGDSGVTLRSSEAYAKRVHEAAAEADAGAGDAGGDEEEDLLALMDEASLM
jgi:hypothetical protein